MTALRIIRQRFRAIFPPRAVRIPGKFPWAQPKPLPAGTVLIAGDPPVVADGKGGIIVPGFGGFVKETPPSRAFWGRTG